MTSFLGATRKVVDQFETVVGLHPYERLPIRGVAGEFRDEDDGVWRYLLVRGVHLEHVFVMITANDVETKFPKMRSQYLQILDSLVLKDPKP